MRMPFGKHKGKDLRNIPHHYLDWVLTLKCTSPDLQDGIRQLLGYTQEKYPSVERALRPEKAQKEQKPTYRSNMKKLMDAKIKANREKRKTVPKRSDITAAHFLQLPENIDDYALCMTANVQEMAAASERLRQRWEARA